jgi:hypothetical protein
MRSKKENGPVENPSGRFSELQHLNRHPATCTASGTRAGRETANAADRSHINQ